MTSTVLLSVAVGAFAGLTTVLLARTMLRRRRGPTVATLTTWLRNRM